MNNPYPKQPSGSYKQPLIEALKEIGEERLSRAFETGELKLAITATITGAVEVHRDVTVKCVEALLALKGYTVTDYYLWGLQHGQFIVASTNGVFVYDPEDSEAKKYVESELNRCSPAADYFD